MKWILPLLVLGWIAAETSVFLANPFHASVRQLPLRLFGLQVSEEPGNTMSPGVKARQYVVVTAWPYLHGEPAVGDVVAFTYPQDPASSDLQRVIAVGGSTIAINDGVTYVDGQAIKESWVDPHNRQTARSRWLPPVVVPAGTYFLMGDNRDESEDSRELGAVGRGRIYGRMTR